MKRQFVETDIFSKRWKELNLDDDDLLKLQWHLAEYPDAGKVISGTNGARKIRFALPHKGKSGGARVIYVDVLHHKRIYLLLCYAKAKQENLTGEQKQLLSSLIKTIKEG